MRARWPWGISWKPAGEPEEEQEEQCPQVRRDVHIEHHDDDGAVEAESTWSEHSWAPENPVEEAVYVEDPAADEAADPTPEGESSSDVSGEESDQEAEAGSVAGGRRSLSSGRGRRRSRGKRMQGGLPVRTFVGAAAAVLLALVAVVASWRRRQLRRQGAAAG